MIKLSAEIIDQRFKGVRGHKDWTLTAKRLTLPVLDAAAYLEVAVRDRIQQTGRAARGPLPSYAQPKQIKGRLWVPPDQPQPQPAKYQIRTGEFAGWAVYPSVQEYGRLRGHRSGPLKLTETGQLWESFRARPVRPGHVTIDFRGGRKRWPRRKPRPGDKERRVSNRTIARAVAQASKLVGLLQPTADELRVVGAIARAEIAAQLGMTEEQYLGALGASQRSSALSRQVEKLRKGVTGKRGRYRRLSALISSTVWD